MQTWLISINKAGKINASPLLMLTNLHKNKCAADIFAAEKYMNTKS